MTGRLKVEDSQCHFRSQRTPEFSPTEAGRASQLTRSSIALRETQPQAQKSHIETGIASGFSGGCVL
jgi:hypothetical protein